MVAIYALAVAIYGMISPQTKKKIVDTILETGFASAKDFLQRLILRKAGKFPAKVVGEVSDTILKEFKKEADAKLRGKTYTPFSGGSRKR